MTFRFRSSSPVLAVLISALFLALGIARLLEAARVIGPVPVRMGTGTATFFTAMGAWMLGLGLHSLAAGRRAARLRAAHPGEPWLWRPDWEAGRANAQSEGSVAGAWATALIWLTATLQFGPTMLRALQREQGDRLIPALVMTILAAVGALLLFRAVRASLRRVRFGRTFVRIETVPAPLGGKLRGALEVPLPQGLQGVHLRLECIHREASRTGDSQSTSESVRWTSERSIAASEVRRGPRGAAAIPVEFEIPRDLPASAPPSSSGSIVWRLLARAEVPGIDFSDAYEVPVFATARSPTLEEWRARERARENAHPLAPPSRQTIDVASTGGGGVSYSFRAGRNRSAAILMTTMLIGMGGLVAFILAEGGPLPLAVLAGFFVTALAWATVDLWFTRSRVCVEAGELVFEASTLGFRRSRRWAREQIRDVRCKIATQLGNAVYYDIVVFEAAGRERTLGSGVRDEKEAHWIAQELRRALNVDL